MGKNKIIIVLIMVLFLILLCLFFIEGVKKNPNITGEVIKNFSDKETEDDSENSDNTNNNQKSDIENQNPIEGVSDSESNLKDSPTLPDINSKPCGFYFQEYNVCGGICSVGECVQEGKSCYCKIG